MAPNLLLTRALVRDLDLESLPLERRATYRRVLAVMKAQPGPFVVAGALGLAVHAGVFVDEDDDGELEIYVRPADLDEMLDAVAVTGYRIVRDGVGRASLPDHHVRIRAALPDPLAGAVDEAWFEHAGRAWLLGLRVRIAPAEELLWLRIATRGPGSLGDPLIASLLSQAHDLDWGRITRRLAGYEALLLAHLFLYWHLEPELAGTVIPRDLLHTLIGRLERVGAENSVSPA